MVVVIALLSGMAPLASEQVGRLQPGSNPSVLPGPVLIADRGNDRLVLVDPEGRVLWTFPEPGDLAPGEPSKVPDDVPARIYGPGRQAAARTTHRGSSGSPNGAFPMRNGHYLVTEIRGAWIDEFDLRTGTMLKSFRAPSVRYPADTNEIAPGRYLTADYSKPGQLVIFDDKGHVFWRYKPGGKDALDRPSLALALPNGDIIANDDYNHRVIVVDPKTNRIVWQYGETGRPGREPGRLNIPDGLDLAPPHSLLMRHAATMGTP